MSEHDKYSDLLYAYSLGCLDSEDLKKLKEFFKSGGEFSWQELGEYQNLAALFPSILKMELPGPELKDKVARRLYRLRGDKVPLKKAKQEEDRPGLTETEMAVSPEQETVSEQKDEVPSAPESIEEKNIDVTQTNDETDLDLSNFEEVKSKKQDKDILASLPDVNIAQETVSAGSTDEDDFNAGHDSGKLTELLPADSKVEKTDDNSARSFYDPQDRKSKKNTWPVLISVLFILIAAGMTFMYFNLTKEVKSYKSGINELNDKINNLSSKVNENESLKKIFQSKDIVLVNLIGTDLSPQGMVKLIIGTINRNCVLQLTGLPSLPGNGVYQLWLKENGSFISAGIFNPDKSENYFHFKLPDVQLTEVTDFILTAEPSGGSNTPGKKTYLTGSLN